MAKVADIGSKRLISAAPTAWVQWLTGDHAIVADTILSSELQFVGRASDTLIKVHSAQHGEYLVAIEIQFRVDQRMPWRMRSYVALIEERYRLPVYPVVINILPTAQPVAHEYRKEFLGIRSLQQYRVINLWELEAEQVLDGGLPTLLPFVPIMHGGDRVDIVQRAVYALRSNVDLTEFESFLAFIANFVLDAATVSSIMGWDMAMLRENPWYNEALQEGIKLGREEGREEGREAGREEGREEGILAAVQHVLTRRFGMPDAALQAHLRGMAPDDLLDLLDIIYAAPSLEAVLTHIDASRQ